MQAGCEDASGRSCQEHVPCDVAGTSTAHNTGGARKVGDAKVKKDRKVRSQVARRKTKVGVVQRVAAVCLDFPRVRALRHNARKGTHVSLVRIE